MIGNELSRSEEYQEKDSRNVTKSNFKIFKILDSREKKVCEVEAKGHCLTE